MLLWLLSCAPSDAILYARALHNEDYEAAQADCARIRTKNGRGDCSVAVMEAHDRLKIEACTQIEEGLWRDECVFLYAEHLGETGQLAAAIESCSQTHFARECSFHLIRQGLRSVLHLSPTEAAQITERYRDLPWAPDANRLFWRTWWRERLSTGLPLDPTLCPEEAPQTARPGEPPRPSCQQGARETLEQLLIARQRRHPDTFCQTPPSSSNGPGVDWVDSPRIQDWIHAWVGAFCGNDVPYTLKSPP